MVAVQQDAIFFFCQIFLTFRFSASQTNGTMETPTMSSLQLGNAITSESVTQFVPCTNTTLETITLKADLSTSTSSPLTTVYAFLSRAESTSSHSSTDIDSTELIENTQKIISSDLLTTVSNASYTTDGFNLTNSQTPTSEWLDVFTLVILLSPIAGILFVLAIIIVMCIWPRENDPDSEAGSSRTFNRMSFFAVSSFRNRLSTYGQNINSRRVNRFSRAKPSQGEDPAYSEINKSLTTFLPHPETFERVAQRDMLGMMTINEERDDTISYIDLDSPVEQSIRDIEETSLYEPMSPSIV